MLQEGAHIVDCFIRDDYNGPVELALEYHKRILERQGHEVIRYWPEPDYKPLGDLMIDLATFLPELRPTTYTKHPPYLFLVRRKAK